MGLFKPSKNAVEADRELEIRQKTHDSAVSLSTAQNQNTIHKLPVEVIQQIASYLEPSNAAAFCLSTRFICYAVGTQQLHNFLSGPTSKIDRRKNIEVLERAFSSHWYCAWCDRFHRHDPAHGPRNLPSQSIRDCDECSSYLHAGTDYILTYKHARLALNRNLWGPDYGIPLEDFTFEKESTTKAFGSKVNVPTQFSVSAKIVSSRLLLHSAFTIVIPPSALQGKNFYAKLQKALPQIVYGHRNDRAGHSGLFASINHAIGNNSKYTVQLCSTCATDYLVRVHSPNTDTFQTVPEAILLSIQAWRDLGDCRSPFDACWRAHGELGEAKPGFGGDTVRLTDFEAGEIRSSWDLEVPLKIAATGRENHLGRPFWWDLSSNAQMR
ncbi:hypothetical protein BCR34DRAFT_506712 [Clohesyomyces aquaticus]|uniref:F-box domain-containing protein n=1 Tax=Clohesyomyces aquaticus TaxID=1231657 RepID=A0A1Y2A2P1_9PLEO|nr:hypothetical protein BCR34DRAFT_506712 [Clohesyomyces aquaticus]